jgi:2-hydroxychromene-2-carboxylate isomerase
LKAALLPPTTFSFYFDYSSPYAYLGATQVRALAARTRATIDYQPILLGGLFRSIGTPNVPLFEMPEPKRNYLAQELPRFAERFGVPFRFTSHFPVNTVKALRLTLAADKAIRPTLIDSLYRAVWVEDRDISSLAELAVIAKACGADEALARIEEPEVKAALHSSTNAARDCGVFGVPSLVIEGELYWGQDRLAQAESALMERRGTLATPQPAERTHA